MSNEELKQKIVEWFNEKSKGAKKKFYVKDVVKAFKADYPKKEIQHAITDCTVDGTVMYWSSGSTTMLTLPEFFPKE